MAASNLQRWSGNRRWDFSGGEVDLLLREFFEGRRWKAEILREQLLGGVANPVGNAESAEFGKVAVIENEYEMARLVAQRLDDVAVWEIPDVNVNLNVNLNVNSETVFFSPTYVFATPILNGQFAVGMAAIVGRTNADVSGTLTASVGPLVATRQGTISDSLTAFGDLYPQASLRWNSGVNNWMVYGLGDIPVGNYNSGNLANLGIGHGAADAGAGYTYFDPKTGHEFSTVTGLTYNLLNPSTGYQNGIDWHTDWGASQFLTKQLHVGTVQTSDQSENATIRSA